jgi:hypothetical protein
VVEVRTANQSVALSTDEAWRLYVLLGDNAPFVRSRLSTIRRGGTGSVSLATSEERADVLAALKVGGRGSLSEGLHSLRAALRTTPTS